MGLAKRIKTHVGDVFTFPLGNGEFAFGQIVDDQPQDCFVIFGYKNGIFPNIQEITDNKIIILTYSIDLFIKTGRWTILGNVAPPIDIVFPNYKISVVKDGKTKTVVVDNKGQYLHDATKKEILTLKYRNSFTPAVLENAAKYKLAGMGEYRDEWASLFYE
jgi:hypothetical protein